ncbi:MAG TPA: LytTR family DNA-binding domain-containing protein, partial [Cytophagales bacterium]
DHKKAKVYFRDKAVTLPVSLQYLETRLPAELFVRANRSQILNVTAVAKADELVDGTIQLTLQDGFSGTVLLSRRQSALFRHRCAL